MGGGGKGKGGGGDIKADVHATINDSASTHLDLTGSLDKINVTSTLNGNLLDKVNVTSALNGNLLDKVNVTTSATNTVLVPQPIHTISDANVDVKPLQADLCFTFGFGRVPSTCIRLPYRDHVGFTLFGVEVFGMNFAGERQIVIEELSHRPQVDWGREEPDPRPPAPGKHHPEHAGGALHIYLGD